VTSQPTIVPATPDRWDDVLRLFGPTGAYSNCWCTWWVLRSREWEATPAAERRAVLEGMVASGSEPGLLAYVSGEPVGWCAVGPRERYSRMTSPRSTVYRPLDGEPSWVINCFFVARSHRGLGIATRLLGAAIEYAFSHGAQRIEAYPRQEAASAAELYVGSLEMFRAEGFEEVARMRGRPLVRLTRPA
jgi:GNAT superfamily N-acetyltransferase